MRINKPVLNKPAQIGENQEIGNTEGKTRDCENPVTITA